MCILAAYDPELRIIEQELTKRFTGLEPISFLQKPFSAQALYDCVERALAGALPDE